MIKNFAELIDRLLQDPVKKKVAVVCAQDEHTLEAVIKAYKEKLISPVLIGEKEGIEAILKKEGADLSGAEIIDITDPSGMRAQSLRPCTGRKSRCHHEGAP